MKTFKKQPIRVQLFSIILLLMITVPIISLLFYHQTRRIIIKQNIKHNSEIANILQQDISDFYNDITNLMVYTGYHSAITDFMNSTTNLETFKSSKSIFDLFRLIDGTQSGVSDIAVTNKNGKTISLYGYNTTKIPSTCLNYNNGNVYYDQLAEINLGILQNVYTFSFTMNIFSDGSIKPIGENVGYLRVLIDSDFINNSLKQLPNMSSTNIILIDRDNKIFTSKNPSGLTLTDENFTSIKEGAEYPIIQTIDKNKYLIQVYSLPEIEGSVITLTAYDDLVSGIAKVRSASFLFFLALLILVSIPYLIIVRNFITPLNELMNFMVTLNEGNLKVLKDTVSLEGYAEIEVISNEFNQMLNQINSLHHQLFTTTTSLYQQELETQKQENEYLQRQINPHFLFNTLDSIKGIALACGSREIYALASSFGAIFRYSTDSQDFPLLKDELKAAEHFLKIISIRFDDRIGYKIECAKEFDCQTVPKMILQPIIEHAITYGLEPLVEGGLLIIKVINVTPKRYQIHIIDNGIGLEEQDVLALNESLMADSVLGDVVDSKFASLHSINLRLKIAYGDDFGLSLKSSKGNGLETTILLPFDLGLGVET